MYIWRPRWDLGNLWRVREIVFCKSPYGVDIQEEMGTAPEKGGGECGSVSQMTFLLALANVLTHQLDD